MLRKKIFVTGFIMTLGSATFVALLAHHFVAGEDSQWRFIAIVSSAIFCYGGCVWAFVDRQLLGPVIKLSARVLRMSNGSYLMAQLEPTETDELSQLSGAINRLRFDLDNTHKEMQRYRLLFAHTHEIVLFVRMRDGQILEANQAAVAAYGYSYEELLRRNIYDLRALQSHPETASQMAQANVEGILFEALHRRKDGSTFLAEVSSTGATIENQRVLMSVVRDITRRKQREEQIQSQLMILSTLYAGAQKLAQSLDSAELAQSVARTCVESFQLKLAWVGRAEPDGRVSVLAQYPADCDYPRQITVRWDDTPEGQGPAGQVIRTQKPVVIDDLLSSPYTSPWKTWMQQYDLHSVASVPLVSRQHGFGALLLYGDQLSQFTPERVAFFQSYALLAAASLENARLFDETTRRLQHVQALHKIDTAMTSSLDLSATLAVLLEQTTTQLGVDAAAVLLYDPQARELVHTAGRGFRTAHVQRMRVGLNRRYAGRAARERRTIVSDWWQRTNAEYADPEYEAIVLEEGFKAHVSAPLVTKGQVVGVLEVFHRSALDMNTEWLELLETLAGQAAITILGASVLDRLQRSHAELEKAYNSTLEGWSRALDLRDKETEGHSQRVTEMTAHLAQAFGLDATQITNLRRGALLHDIGKIGVPDRVLLKEGGLTDEEWVIMRKHPQYAYDMISPIGYLAPAIDIPYCHHEKWDGSGYPRRLKGEEIPLAARIFAVVDVWDALTSDRSYRPAWPTEQARKYIRKQSGVHFDPQVVDAFFRLGLDHAW